MSPVKTNNTTTTLSKDVWYVKDRLLSGMVVDALPVQYNLLYGTEGTAIIAHKTHIMMSCKKNVFNVLQEKYTTNFKDCAHVLPTKTIKLQTGYVCHAKYHFIGILGIRFAKNAMKDLFMIIKDLCAFAHKELF